MVPVRPTAWLSRPVWMTCWLSPTLSGVFSLLLVVEIDSMLFSHQVLSVPSQTAMATFEQLAMQWVAMPPLWDTQRVEGPWTRL